MARIFYNTQTARWAEGFEAVAEHTLRGAGIEATVVGADMPYPHVFVTEEVDPSLKGRALTLLWNLEPQFRMVGSEV